MTTLIAVPCMDFVHTLFFTSVLNMAKPAGSQVAVSVSSLVYNARNLLAKKALDEGFDRVLWLDSDMRFSGDLLERLAARLDEGREFVTALYFSRKEPVRPCVYELIDNVKNERGEDIPTARPVRKVTNGLFRVAGCGFGAVMMTTELIRRCGKSPFFPISGFGEDFSFCLRAREAGAELWCDGSVRPDHIGTTLINENNWTT